MAEHGTVSVVGIDLSTKMLEKAQVLTSDQRIQYQNAAMEDFELRVGSFDVVLSSLAIHYISDFDSLCKKIYETLSSQGVFIFSVEHPVFTADGSQDWIFDAEGNKLYWPVDHYFNEGKRTSVFLGQEIIKYHRTVDTYINKLLSHGFSLIGFAEPVPEEHMLAQHTDWNEELRKTTYDAYHFEYKKSLTRRS